MAEKSDSVRETQIYGVQMKSIMPSIFQRPTVTTGQSFSQGYANQPGALGLSGMPTIYDISPRVVAGDATILSARGDSWTYRPGAGLPFGFAGPEWSTDVQ